MPIHNLLCSVVFAILLAFTEHNRLAIDRLFFRAVKPGQEEPAPMALQGVDRGVWVY